MQSILEPQKETPYPLVVTLQPSPNTRHLLIHFMSLWICTFPVEGIYNMWSFVSDLFHPA